MPIKTSLVPGIQPGTLRDEYRVDGDRPYATHPTKEQAEQREAELAAKNDTD
jgi:hypothetical protein